MIRTGPNLGSFSDWVKRVLRSMKEENGWGITRVAKEAGVSRALLTNWRDGKWSQGKPTRESVERFCDNLRLSKEEPFGYLGFSLSPREAAQTAKARDVPPETDLDRRIRIIQARLDQDPPTEERRRLERLLVRAKRQREEQRLMDEEIAEILGGEPDPSHPSE